MPRICLKRSLVSLTQGIATIAVVLAAIQNTAYAQLKRIEKPSEEQRIVFKVTRIRPDRFEHPETLEAGDHTVILRVEKAKGRFVRLYDATSKQPIGPPISASDGIGLTALAIAPDDKTIAIGSTYSDGGGSAIVWDATTGKQIAKWESGGVVGLQFGDDGKTLKIKCGLEPKS